MTSTKKIHLTEPLAQYAHLRQAGDLFFLAGQGCRDPISGQCRGITRDPVDGHILSYDIKEQTRGCFDNLERVLTAHNLGIEHLIDITVFLKNINDFPLMNQIWNEYFTQRHSPSPTRTTVAVLDLPEDNFIEMKAIAYKNAGS